MLVLRDYRGTCRNRDKSSPTTVRLPGVKIEVVMKHKKSNLTLSPAKVLTFLFQEERRSGVVLILAAIAALVLANTAWADVYFGFIDKKLSLGAVTLDIQHWVSEGLMALFFLVVTLEVKRELIDGELRSWRRASFPVIAAIGGMLAPAFIYVLLNQNHPESAGWAIPIATDIAIAVGVLALLGNRVPKNLRIFLLALAIIDDIGSIIIISLFYNHPTNSLAVLAAITLCLPLVLLRNQRYWVLTYTVLGLLLWYCLMLAGISGTMAGVLLAALAPLTTSRSNLRKLQSSEKIEDILLPVTAYLVVPLFVFCNAGLAFSSLRLTEGDSLAVFTGVLLGLLIGKPLGIVAAGWTATSLRLAKRPAGITWTHLLGVGFVAGIGFTISLLIADLSLGSYAQLQNAAIFGVFVASVLSGFLGLLILGLHAKRPAFYSTHL
jgi:Na+:H+ antiporter, NhaA family